MIIAIYKSTFTKPYHFSYSFTANSPRNLPVEFLKENLVRFDRIMAIHEFVASLFGPPCIQYIAATPPQLGRSEARDESSRNPGRRAGAAAAVAAAVAKWIKLDKSSDY